jgi:hypothetical protein
MKVVVWAYLLQAGIVIGGAIHGLFGSGGSRHIRPTPNRKLVAFYSLT